MKHWMMIGAISCLFLSACSDNNEAKPEVQPIQEEKTNNTGTEANQQTIINTPTPTNVPSIKELTSSIKVLAEKVNNTKTTGVQDKDSQTFFNLKQEIDALDDQLDLNEDQLEADYRTGTIQADQYKQQERELDLLDDQLDQADDMLEMTFGIDD